MMYKKGQKKIRVSTKLKVGDTVMIIAGGNEQKRKLKGETGKIKEFIAPDRVIIDGHNIVTRHQKAKTPEMESGKIPKEAPINISNVMYFDEKLQSPVRLCYKVQDDGSKTRGYLEKGSNNFVSVD